MQCIYKYLCTGKWQGKIYIKNQHKQILKGKNTEKCLKIQVKCTKI